MGTHNRVSLIGRVGSDPELRATNSGKRVANLSIATDRYKSDTPDWHRLVLFDKHAEVAEQYVRKGDLIHVEGRIQYGSYERDGQSIPTCEIVCERLTLLGAKRDEGETPF